MAHNVPVQFEAHLAGERRWSPRFVAEGGPGTIVIRGEVSAGGGGWVLSARATRQRRRIALHVVAKHRGAALLRRDLEDFDYVATLTGIEPGRYRIRLSHLFHAPELGVASDPTSPAELTAYVTPEEGTRAGAG